MGDDGSYVLIGPTADNYVAVIHLKPLTVTGHIATARLPARLFMIGKWRIYAFF